jgi:uncharacterized protein (DUF1800 family)
MDQKRLSRRDFLKLSGIMTASSAVLLQQNRGVRALFAPRNTDLNAQAQAARFLTQATLGANSDLIQRVAASGAEDWLEDQFSIPPNSTQKLVKTYDPEIIRNLGFGDTQLFRWAWWQQTMTEPDLLRHRIALALSEIFVVSTRSSDLLEDAVLGMASYHDMLGKHAFGNFRDLLLDVTLHPVMGHFLSHLQNRKSDPSLNRFPDENFAREIMQLFSIGLWELNADGTRRLDGKGDPIATYDNNDITEFAKVFTGLTYVNDSYEEDFFIEDGQMYEPMSMYEPEHEPGPKNLLNGFIIPNGQDGMRDIEDAVENLFSHSNVGPFIGRLLIQRLVTSNPSPAYISRVSKAFDNNGNGVRGDMQAFIRAILLDPEARDLEKINDPKHGMLREPFVRYVHLLKAMNAKSATGKFPNLGEMAATLLQQYPFFSPSVFNFFLPDYRPLGAIGNAGLVAPEFQITTSFTALTAINFMQNVIIDDFVMDNGYDLLDELEFRNEQELEGFEQGEDEEDEDDEDDEEFEDDQEDTEEPDEDEDEDEEEDDEDEDDEHELPKISLDFSEALALSNDPAALVAHYDLLLTYGSLSDEMRDIIEHAVAGLKSPIQRAKMALYLISISPDFAILK